MLPFVILYRLSIIVLGKKNALKITGKALTKTAAISGSYIIPNTSDLKIIYQAL